MLTDKFVCLIFTYKHQKEHFEVLVSSPASPAPQTWFFFFFFWLDYPLSSVSQTQDCREKASNEVLLNLHSWELPQMPWFKSAFAVCSSPRDVWYFNCNVQQVSIQPPPYCSLISLTATNKHNQHAGRRFWRLFLLNGFFITIIMEISVTVNVTLELIFPPLWRETSMFSKAAPPKNTCFVL